MEIPEYRAFDFRSQDMLKVMQMTVHPSHSLICKPKEFFSNPITLNYGEFALMQKSPYKDSDGKDIFDGDFILYLDYKKNWRINQIYWGGDYSPGWMIKGGKWSKSLSKSHIYNGEVRVIGNIYQNDRLSLIFLYSQNKDLLPAIKYQ